MATDRQVGSNILRHQDLKAVVHRRCVNCHAPGVFSSEKWVLSEYPRCWVEEWDARRGHSVGNICPHCYQDRDKHLIEDRGVIWERWVFGSQWAKFKHTILSRLDKVTKKERP